MAEVHVNTEITNILSSGLLNIEIIIRNQSLQAVEVNADINIRIHSRHRLNGHLA